MVVAYIESFREEFSLLENDLVGREINVVHIEEEKQRVQQEQYLNRFVVVNHGLEVNFSHVVSHGFVDDAPHNRCEGNSCGRNGHEVFVEIFFLFHSIQYRE